MKPQPFLYTTLANRLTARYPFMSYVGIQINFWVVANILLVTIAIFQSRISSLAYGIDVNLHLGTMLGVAVAFGVFYGGIFGSLSRLLEKSIFRRLPVGKVMLYKTVVAAALLVLLLYLLRFSLLGRFTASPLNIIDSALHDDVWGYIFYLLLIYYFVMALLISYINQVNNKYGPGVLVPLLMGRYRHPREEERIFMFMDLKSSTTTAEKLGHLQYSSFIRDCFSDINELLFPFRAQVYQYVGDEIVVMWPEQEGLKHHRCVQLFFACRKRFQEKAAYYTNTYGLTPTFKAGLHSGKVTVVEIGEIKKDIAYHGDTLNTAARIQSVCNHYDKDFLASAYILSKMGASQSLQVEPLGLVPLRGKSVEVEIASLEWVDVV